MYVYVCVSVSRHVDSIHISRIKDFYEMLSVFPPLLSAVVLTYKIYVEREANRQAQVYFDLLLQVKQIVKFLSLLTTS